MHRLLSSAAWDAAEVLKGVRDWTIKYLGQEDAILVLDETGDVKKGRATVGVQRLYTCAAGRIENSQVDVCLTYASDKARPWVPTTTESGTRVGYTLRSGALTKAMTLGLRSQAGRAVGVELHLGGDGRRAHAGTACS